MPEATPLRLSSAEDRFRSGVSAGLLGESAEMAQDAPGLLDEISPGPSRAGGTKPSKTALAGPKTAPGESCKQQLGYQPSGEFSIACPFWVAVFDIFLLSPLALGYKPARCCQSSSSRTSGYRYCGMILLGPYWNGSRKLYRRQGTPGIQFVYTFEGRNTSFIGPIGTAYRCVS